MRPEFCGKPRSRWRRNNALTHAPMQFKFETMAPLYQTVALFSFSTKRKSRPSERPFRRWLELKKTLLAFVL